MQVWVFLLVYLIPYVVTQPSACMHESAETYNQDRRTQSNIRCNMRLAVGDAINITSPGFPCSFPRSVSCEWRLEVSSGKVMKISLLTFDLPDRDECCHRAFVEYGHFDSKNRKVVDSGRLCGIRDPKVFLIDGSQFWLTLTSHWYQSNDSHSGLFINVEATKTDEAGFATLIAVGCFLVPLICAFPLYHCVKRATEISRRKKLLAKLHRLRHEEMEERRKRVAQNISTIERTMSSLSGYSSVFSTIYEDSEIDEVEQSVRDKHPTISVTDNGVDYCEDENNNNSNKVVSSLSVTPDTSKSVKYGEIHETSNRSKTRPLNLNLLHLPEIQRIRSNVSASSPSMFESLSSSTPCLAEVSKESSCQRSSKKNVTFAKSADRVFRYSEDSQKMTSCDISDGEHSSTIAMNCSDVFYTPMAEKPQINNL